MTFRINVSGHSWMDVTESTARRWAAIELKRLENVIEDLDKRVEAVDSRLSGTDVWRLGLI